MKKFSKTAHFVLKMSKMFYFDDKRIEEGAKIHQNRLRKTEKLDTDFVHQKSLQDELGTCSAFPTKRTCSINNVAYTPDRPVLGQGPEFLLEETFALGQYYKISFQTDASNSLSDWLDSTSH